MSSFDQNRVVVLAVLETGLSPAEAARRFKVSRQWVHVLLIRYAQGGEAGLEPRSRRPATNPAATPEEVRARIRELRDELAAAGLDAGAESIADRLGREGVRVPAVSTIWRVLRAAQLVVPQPQKRPRSSWHRFEAAQPNQTWQSDFTHWVLADGTDTEVISWLDDCSRYLLHISAHPRVTGITVTTSFTKTAEEYGYPASTLTDNGMVYTTRFAHGKGGPNAFEYLLKRLGISQKNGAPYHPQTQGKIERFHQTLKKWLAIQPPARTRVDLDAQLARFQHIYNHERPHRALERKTPAEVYTSLPKAVPAQAQDQHWRVRYDKIDSTGTVSLRYSGAMRHLAIGRTHQGKRVIVLIAGPDVMIADIMTGEILAEHTIDRNKSYQPKKKQKLPPEGESFCQ
ncbi:transposase (plasmid) [Arthrobacter sp. ERGS1:01]|uniref:IS481 family transposase n=1 Tax=Arthrobacter sp. ERGS1:01 TaxID=1704044 RepID=UPI0006B4FA70|nr:IS481 family transposase [Arthrobacter sp. ERGS1:01]ALE04610.1 transposase [Arthrobacter sp. ERGS1:01]